MKKHPEIHQNHFGVEMRMETLQNNGSWFFLVLCWMKILKEDIFMMYFGSAIFVSRCSQKDRDADVLR